MSVTIVKYNINEKSKYILRIIFHRFYYKVIMWFAFFSKAHFLCYKLTNHILMIRPANFGYNAETAQNNAFQNSPLSMESKGNLFRKKQ